MKMFRWIKAFGVVLSLLLTQSVAAVEALPQTKTDGLAYEAWRAAQEHRQVELLSRIGELPAIAAAMIEFTAGDAETVAAKNASGGSGVPYMVGVVKPLRLDVDFARLKNLAASTASSGFDGGILRRTESGSLAWAMRVDALDVGGLRLKFEDVHLPEGAELYVHNGAGAVRGPYVGEHKVLWSHSIAGDSVFIQVHYPQGSAAALRQIRFRIGAALALDPSPQAFCPQNAPCIEDGTCFDAGDWAQIDNVRKAVASMLFIEGPGAFICTGGLLNDTDNSSFIPYFLTANHCISSNAVASTLETFFDFRTSSCGGACFTPSSPSTNGATLLHASAQDDHSLLRLGEDPPAGSVLLGWTTQAVANTNGAMLYRLSHPKRAPQAYSTHQVDTSAGTCGGLPRGSFIYSRDIVGAVEGGSSGSPVMNAAAQVVGQLFGACGLNPDDVCNSDINATVDGAFASYFSDVERWLNPSPGGCPLTEMVADLPDRDHWLTLAYDFRDQVLPTLPEGAWMHDAFYRHASEVTWRILFEPQLRDQALALLRSVGPAISAAMNDDSVLVLGVDERLAISRFARTLQRDGSNGLKRDLAHFLSLLGSFQ